MSAAIFVILSLVVLYFSQKILLRQFVRLVNRFGGSRKALIVLWSIVFLPGTVIHELSHFLFAILVGARTGKIEVFPEFLEDDDGEGGVALGYVQTQKLNPVQGVLVGLAPFIVGVALLVWISTAIQSSYLTASVSSLVLQGYLFFTISNSFFPSRSDLNHAIPAGITIVIIAVILWLVGVQFSYTPSQQVLSLMQTVFITLLISTGLNSLISIPLFLLRRFL